MSDRGVSMQRLPTAGRWAVYIALAIVFAIACAFLSHWQFSRNHDRSAQLALVEANYDAEPVPVASVIEGTDAWTPADEWRPVVLQGTYLSGEQVLARNRAHGGTSAYEVLVPLLLEDGRVMIVDRGWVEPGETGDGPEQVPAPPAGEVTVIGRLRPGEALPASGRGAPEGQVPTIHLPSVAEGLDLPTISSAYVLMASEDPGVPVTPQQLESPSADPGPYLSYAIQWILFALMGFIFIGYVIRTEVRHRREDAADAAAAAVSADADDRSTADAGSANGVRDGEHGAADRPQERASSTPRRRTPARRRDRDAEDEDAILDTAGR